MIRHLFVLLAALCLAASGPQIAAAHAEWLHGTIKTNEVLKRGHLPHRIAGFFAEQLDPAHSWMAIFEGGGDHGLVTERDRSFVNYKNPREMILPLTHTNLTPDRYYLLWYTRSAEDGHVAAGVIYFNVE